MKNKIIKPARLESGMTIGLIAPASGAPDPAAIDRGITVLQSRGFRVKEAKSLRARWGFLAAPDAARLADLHAMIANPKIGAIMCMRGGYGVMRLLPRIDYALAARNPKIIVGFSDITALHLALWKKCGLVTFNGPMLLSAFAKERPGSFTLGALERTLMNAVPSGSVWEGLNSRQFRVVRHGRVSGRLIGGNLSLVAATIGTPYEIDTRGKIVFLEEVDEKPYRVDRMLTQLLLAGKLRDAVAVVFGRNVPDAESAVRERKLAGEGLPRLASPPPARVPRDYEPVLDEVIAERLRPLGIPVLIGLPFGHIDDYATIPIGVEAVVDTRRGELVICESAVR
ncbi:MAG: LD-carboxypeptidase [bacterium]